MSSTVRIAVSKLFTQYKAKMFVLPTGWYMWKNRQWKVLTRDVAVSYGGRISREDSH
jgi:hypothetical protein